MTTANDNTTKRLQTLEEHQAFLKEVLTTAQQRVVIVSPFISIKAIEHDNLLTEVARSVSRGVEVNIFTDFRLNCIGEDFKPSAADGIAALVKMGAKVAILTGIHNKTLIVDSCLIAEGSFNWLSAVRIRNGECQREERTLVYTGETASEMIAREITHINTYEYKFAEIANKPVRNFRETKRGVLVLALIIAAAAFFLKGDSRIYTVIAFSVGLLPFMISAVRNDLFCNVSYEQEKSSVPFDHDRGQPLYRPGVTDQSGRFVGSDLR